MSNDYVIVGGELYHYGVKGMKWGVRRAQKAKNKYAAKAKRQVLRNNANAKSLKKSLDSDWDETTESRLDKETRKAYEHEMQSSIKADKSWMQTRKDIMNMDVNTITPKDVKKRFNDGIYESGSYYPF